MASGSLLGGQTVLLDGAAVARAPGAGGCFLVEAGELVWTKKKIQASPGQMFACLALVFLLRRHEYRPPEDCVDLVPSPRASFMELLMDARHSANSACSVWRLAAPELGRCTWESHGERGQ